MDKLLSSIKTLATPKNVAVLSLGSFLLLMSFLTPLIGIPLLFDYKIDINPEINFDKSILECLEQSDVLATNIAEPQKSDFYSDETIALAGEYTFKCSKTSLENVKLAWLLNDEKEPFSKEQSATLSSLKSGNYKVTFKVNGTSETGKVIENSISKDLAITDRPAPTPVYVPPVNPPAHTNQGPSVTIVSPKFTPTPYNQGQAIRFSGAGTDPEDGNLSGSSLQWSYVLSYNGTDDPEVNFGSGTSASLNLTLPPAVYFATYTVTLRATDSNGATAQTSLVLNVGYILY